MRYAPDGEEEPAPLRRLRLLVMVLIIVLILGFVAMAGTIVIRLGLRGGAERVDIDQLTLPAGHDIVVTGQGPGTLHVVLRGPDGVETLHIYDARTGGYLSKTVISRR